MRGQPLLVAAEIGVQKIESFGTKKIIEILNDYKSI
jgi:hypothetical protein